MLAVASPAIANDTAVTFGSGGLIPVKSTAIVMESEDLQISVHQITVNYVFRNTNPHDVDVIVAFPLPEIDGGAVANVPIHIPSNDPLNFIDFKVFVAGKKIAPQVEVRSYFNGSEITKELQALHLPLSALDGKVASAMKKLSATDRSRLERNQWVDCSLTKDRKCWPYWQSRIQYYWTQRFRAGQAVEVMHTYRPVVGGGQMYRSEVLPNTNYVQRYCAGTDAVDQIRRKLQRAVGDQPILREREIQYILTTANNWSGPIGNFHLIVTSDDPADIVLACIPGLRRTAPTQYELAQSNYRPDQEIELLLLQAIK